MDVIVFSAKKVTDIHVSCKKTAKKKEETQNLYENGYAQGLKDGQKMAHNEKEKFQALTLALYDKTQEMQVEYKQFLQQLKEKVSNMAIDTVSYLLQREISAGQYSIEKIVAMAFEELEAIPNLEILEIHCHPQDVHVLEQAGFDNLSIVPNQQIAKADCCFKTNLGKINICLEQRLSQMKNLFLEEQK